MAKRQETFTPGQIRLMQESWNVDRITTKAANGIRGLVERLSDRQLSQLITAKIKFVSALARNEAGRRVARQLETEARVRAQATALAETFGGEGGT